MSGGFDAFDLGSIGGSLTSFAADLGSVVTDFGTEFMSSFPALDAFQIPSFDVASLGGFGQVGSLAGNASWFDTFNPGAILSSIPSVSDFSLSSLTSSLPSLNSIKTAAGAIGLPTTAAGIASGVTKLASNPVALAVASSVTGVPPNLLTSAAGVAGGALTSGSLPSLSSLASNPAALAVAASASGIPPNLIGSAAGVAGSALTTGSLPSLASLASNPAAIATAASVAGISPNISSIAARAVDANGLTILNAAETAELTRNINPAFVSSLVDPGTPREIIDQVTGEIREFADPVNLSNQASQYTTTYNPETGQWDVFDNLTSTTVRSGLSEQDALLAEQDLNIESGISLRTTADLTETAEDPFEIARLAAISDSENARSPTEADVLSAINSQTAALTTQARAQQSIRELRNNKAQASDWRVRLRLAPNSSYLYKAPANQVGILAPLALTDGVIFPYTPSIDTAYKANYDAYDLTHSNYRGYFYKGSYVDAVNVRAQFTAQDTKEADYLLAVIHFFRSCTKMFYGQDVQRGSPPPLVYLNGYGDYQFSEHPCVVSQFNYTLPPDVDYIRAQSTLQSNTNQLNSRLRNPIANNPLAYSVNRLLNSGLISGALDFRPTTPGSGNLATGTPTYVPTKMEISITLLPMQSRSQISNNFSVKEFANGNLLKGGYW
jgi:hypothetical protein